MKSSESEYINRFKKQISDLNLNEKSSVLIAWSGGLDSTVLVYMMKHFSPCRVYTAYYNHCLRPEEELNVEMDLIKKQAGLWNIPLIIGNAGPGKIESLKKSHHGSLEEWSRNERYHFLEATKKRKGIDFLLTAHHRDDEAETLLFRFLQGSSLMGLCGLEDKKPFESTILRPLLCFAREEIQNIAEQFSLLWSLDSSNRNTDFLRNRIRMELIPAVEAIFPDFRANLHKGAKKNRLYAEAAKKAVDEIPLHEEKGVLSLPMVTFLALPSFIRLELLYSMADRLLKGKKNSYRIPYRFFNDLLEGPLDSSIRREGHGLILDGWRGNVRMLLAEKTTFFDPIDPIPMEQWLNLGEWNLFLSQRKIKESSIPLPGAAGDWSIRGRREEDKMLQPGRLKKRLSLYPREERNSIPLLISRKELVCAVLKGARSKIIGDIEINIKTDIESVYLILEHNDAV